MYKMKRGKGTECKTLKGDGKEAGLKDKDISIEYIVELSD